MYTPLIIHRWYNLGSIHCMYVYMCVRVSVSVGDGVDVCECGGILVSVSLGRRGGGGLCC